MTRAMRLLAVMLLALASLPVVTLSATAQDVTATTSDDATPDYAAWEDLATRAEQMLGMDETTDAELDDLRSQLVGWRTRFLDAQGINAARISILRDQIAALGPAPPEGESEPDDIAQRRATLNEQLAELQAPGVKAVEAYRHADGLIRETDSLIRERQASKLLELGPTPLNPAHWDDALAALGASAARFTGEIAEAWATPARRTRLRESLPLTLLLLAMAGVLLTRGRHWVTQLSTRLVEKGRSRGRSVYGALLTLGQVVVPSLGLFLLVAAAFSTGLGGEYAGSLLFLVPVFGFIFFFARWLGGRVFADQAVSRPLFDLPPARMAEGRLLATGLGLAVTLFGFLGLIVEVGKFEAAAATVLVFPVVVAAGLLLFRMGQLLVVQGGIEQPEGGERPYRNRIIESVGRAAMILGVVGPLLGAVGYREAAHFLTFRPIVTIGLLGLLLVLQRFVGDVYDFIARREEDGANGDALIPVLIGLFLGLLALPLLMLIWGARVADLTEIWAKFTEGITIGETRISPANLLTFLVVFTLGYALTRLVQGMLRSTVLPKTKIDPGGQSAIVSGLGYLGIFLAALFAITTAGINLSSLAIVAGALSVGIGFGLRTIVENFVSGIILLIERPVSQGDWIEVGGVMGIVQDISVRSTRIHTFDRTDVIVPNANLISGQVTNWTRNNLTGRLIVKVGVAYGTDTHKVERVLREIGEAHPLAIVNPPPLVVFQGFGADALEFELRVILRNVNYLLSVQTELNHEIARRFAEEGFEIPFAQRDLWLRNPEKVRPEVGAALLSALVPQQPGTEHVTLDDVEPEDRDAESDGDADADAGEGEGR